MPNNGINAGGLVSGSTYYLRIRNQSGQYLYTVTPAFEAYNAAHIASYVVAAGTANTAGGWFGVFPANVATVAGVYDLEIVLRAGGSGAASDSVAGTQTVYWSGTDLWIVTASVVNGYIQPFGITVTQPRVQTQNVAVLQYEVATIAFLIVDANGDPVDLSAATLRFVAWQSDDGGVVKTDLFTRSSSSGITVTGTGNNQVNVAFTQANTQSLLLDGGYYTLWEITPNQIVLVTGSFSIGAAQLS